MGATASIFYFLFIFIYFIYFYLFYLNPDNKPIGLRH